MITVAIMGLITQAILFLMNLITQRIDITVDFANDIANYTDQILAIAHQGINFLHFMFGDTIVIIVPLVIGLLGFKYLVLPIIDFVRRLIPFVNL